jgi:cobyrinic acid a,c-diamide synthase
MIAGTGSGCGKTTITCAVLKALVNRGLEVASFKCGPDYIDPMFHSKIIKAKSRNLDMFLCGEEATKYLFAKNSENTDISVIEGVMGFYDGLSIHNIEFSSCDISNKTNTPVVLVVNCDGLYFSIVAMIKGYIDFYENKIVGVILNNTSGQMYPLYKDSIEKHLNIKVLGFMPRLKSAVLESRHLGLITADEVILLDEKLEELAKTAEENIDLDKILALANNALPLTYREIKVEKQETVRLAIAMDKAFCFYYEDSLELLRQMGAELIPFSPLQDKILPENIDGLILGGGYPELYAETLSENTSMLNSIKNSFKNGLPTYAECGGFMYLGKTISVNDRSYNMVGAIETNSALTNKLQNFGYIRLVAKEDTVFCKKGQGINAHEFHYSKSDKNGNTFEAVKSEEKGWDVGFSSPSFFAGYPHLHLWGNLDFARNFLRKCCEYKNGAKRSNYIN